jgi:hypothetical protein
VAYYHQIGKERILKIVREKFQVTFKGPLRLIADFSAEALQAKKGITYSKF